MMTKILKKAVILGMVAVALLSGTPAMTAYAAEKSPLITTVSVTGKKDAQKVSYKLNISQTTVSDGRIAVVYDPKVLELKKDTESIKFSEVDINKNASDNDGKAIAYAFVNDAPKKVKGTIITLQFDVKEGVENQDSVIKTKVYDINNEDEAVLTDVTLEDTVNVGLKKLKTPEIKSIDQTLIGVNVKWSKDENADGYVLYRSTKKGGEYKKVTTTKSTSYWDVSVSNNKTYYYKVVAFQGKDDNKVFSEYSKVVSIKVKKFFGLFS